VDEMDRSVLSSGKTESKITLDSNEAWLRTVVPFIATKNFRTTNCLKCHSADEGAVLGAASVTISVKNDLDIIKKINTWIWIGQVSLQIVLFFAIGQIIRRLLSKLGGEPSYVANIANNIEQGNLTVQIDTRPGDSTSLLASIARMREGLRTTVREIASCSNDVTASMQHTRFLLNKSLCSFLVIPSNKFLTQLIYHYG
jgi:methyl-accepting chemotaxis protein